MADTQRPYVANGKPLDVSGWQCKACHGKNPWTAEWCQNVERHLELTPVFLAQYAKRVS